LNQRVAFVVQRYGLEVIGGAETLARQVAERLTAHYLVDVITTCATDIMTWRNVYVPGNSIINGVSVHRFATDQPRDPQFDRIYADLLAKRAPTILDEIEWMKAQGPYSTGLLHHLRSHHREYDLLIFVGYLYFQTYFGLQVAPEHSMLIPTTHDEPPLYFDIFNTVFMLPRGLIFLSPEEQQLARKRFRLPVTVPQAVIGGGVTIPENINPGALRAKHGLNGPYILYAGRVDASKQCDVLFDWFLRYRREHRTPLKLICTGKLDMTLPSGDGIRFLGLLPEEEKFSAMAGAAALIMPSSLESFSIATLEAFGVGTPVIANASSHVVRGHCIRSNAGLYYNSYEEFSACLSLILTQLELRNRLGLNGQAYIRANYSWEIVESRYVAFLGSSLSAMQFEAWGV
jgi:glycosyltransferase involved in cell wall biosynthesis